MTLMDEISLATPVEVLVTAHPAAIGFLAQRGVLCVVCGEPFWGTLGELIAQRGLDTVQSQKMVTELSAFLREQKSASGS